MYLFCADNNRAETVADAFITATEECGWPSRVRGNYGGENVRVAELMEDNRRTGRGSFIAGSSTRNQRIERLWRDVFRCVCYLFYCLFYAMEDNGVLNGESDKDLFVLHFVFLPRINRALKEFTNAFNAHPMRTERNWNPDQIWVNGTIQKENILDVQEALPDNLLLYGVDPQGPSPKMKLFMSLTSTIQLI